MTENEKRPTVPQTNGDEVEMPTSTSRKPGDKAFGGTGNGPQPDSAPQPPPEETESDPQSQG